MCSINPCSRKKKGTKKEARHPSLLWCRDSPEYFLWSSFFSIFLVAYVLALMKLTKEFD